MRILAGERFRTSGLLTVDGSMLPWGCELLAFTRLGVPEQRSNAAGHLQVPGRRCIEAGGTTLPI